MLYGDEGGKMNKETSSASRGVSDVVVKECKVMREDVLLLPTYCTACSDNPRATGHPTQYKNPNLPPPTLPHMYKIKK